MLATALWLACVPISIAQPAAAPADQGSLFSLNRIWDVHITTTQEEWDGLYPESGFRFGFGTGRQFPYRKATIQIGSHAAIPVGIRFKGNSTFSSSSGTLKRSLKVDFNRQDEAGEFLGLKKFNLHNNATDPSQIRESVAYAAFRRAGLPTPRNGFARVYLTIEGRIKREYLGFYTITEQVDRGFMKANFKNADGLIVKPEREILGYYGKEWNSEYESTYVPKTEADDAAKAQLVELARLAAEADPGEFAKKIDAVLDVDMFLRYMAVSSILANWDSPFYIAHNIYFVVPKDPGRVVWVPWDLNLSLGASSMMGGNRVDMAVKDPADAPIVQKILAVKAHEQSYERHLRQLIKKACSARAIQRDVRQVMKTVGPAIKAEAKRSKAVTDAGADPGSSRSPFGRGGFGRRRGGTNRDPVGQLLDFAKKREANVLAQLAGTTKGTKMRPFGGRGRGNARGGGGAGGAGGRRRGGGGNRARSLKELLAHSGLLDLGGDRQYSREDLQLVLERHFTMCDRNRSGDLAAAELAQEAKRQARLPKTPKQPADVAAFIARRNHRLLDGDGDGKVTAEEWTRRLEGLLKTWDANEDDKWSATELLPPSDDGGGFGRRGGR